MKNFITGDLFAFQLPTEEWMFGRILLDIYQQCIKPDLLETGSPLASFPKALLVEIYETVSDSPRPADLTNRLIPGMFVTPGSFQNDQWQIVGHQDVNPETVEFPEALINKGRGAHFVRGEISLPIDLSFQQVQELNVYLTEHPSGRIGQICLYHLNRKEEINKPPKIIELSNLGRSDVRFTAYRHSIYHKLNEPEHQSYFEMALRLKYDLRRFYK